MQTYQEKIKKAIKGLGMGSMPEAELVNLYFMHRKLGKSDAAQIIADAAYQVIRLRQDCMGNA